MIIVQERVKGTRGLFRGRVGCALDYEAGDPGSTGYSVLGGNLTRYCCQQYRPRLDNRGGNGTHRGLCWK